ncbi:Unknown protein, partial [Striga hermonthica]
VTPFEWLKAVPEEHWARCFFSSNAVCDVLVNNISESFNNYILEARDMAIVDMFECIRRRMMARIQVKKAGIEKYTEDIFPNTVRKIEEQREISRNCFPTWAGEDKYEVVHGVNSHIVQLGARRCTC